MRLMLLPAMWLAMVAAQTVPLDPALAAVIPVPGATPRDEPLLSNNEMLVTGRRLTRQSVLVGMAGWIGLKDAPGTYIDLYQFVPWVARAKKQSSTGMVSRVR